MVLEIEGINSSRLSYSKIYQVNVRDTRKNLHYLECYGLEEIMRDYNSIKSRKYMMICNRFGIKPSEVKRPDAIHCMISTKCNHLISKRW